MVISNIEFEISAAVDIPSGIELEISEIKKIKADAERVLKAIIEGEVDLLIDKARQKQDDELFSSKIATLLKMFGLDDAPKPKPQRCMKYNTGSNDRPLATESSDSPDPKVKRTTITVEYDIEAMIANGSINEEYPYIAIDADGDMYGYRNKPEFKDGFYDDKDMGLSYIRYLTVVNPEKHLYHIDDFRDAPAQGNEIKMHDYVAGEEVFGQKYIVEDGDGVRTLIPTMDRSSPQNIKRISDPLTII